MKKNTSGRALALALSSVALVGMTGLGTAAADVMSANAFGMQAIEPGDPAVALIDDTAATSLTISKFLGAPIDGPSDGTEVTGIDLPALSGVAFDVYEVGGVDLTTNEGWAAATALQTYSITQADIARGYLEFDVDGDGTAEQFALSLADTVTTTDGVAVFDGGVALYLVNENLAASGEITGPDGVVPTNSITPSAPFLVTLPMTTPSGDGAATSWMYDVFAYPKNTSDVITKAVADEGTLIGADGEATDAYSYTINTSVTPGLTAAQIGTYVVGDQLDPRVTLQTVTLTAGAVSLEAGVDYTVYVGDAAWDGEAAAGAKVEVVLTEAGIQKVITGGGLSTVLDVTATEMGDGIILNDAQFIPNAAWWAAQTGTDDPYDPQTDDPDSDNGTPVDPPTSNEVRSLFGSVNIDKTDAADGAVLDGVTFQLWLDGDGNGSCEPADFADPYVPQYEGVTADGGQLTFSGLQTSNFYDDAVQTEINGYCLIETEAAEGYNLLADPIFFTIDAVEGDDGLYVPTNTDLEVENVALNLDNDLPLTGGQGLALGGLGALLLAGGAAYGLNRRKAMAGA